MKWTAVAVAVGALSLGACRQQPQNEIVENEIANEDISLPPLPIAEPPMNRSAMLFAVAKVASAVALGRNGVAEQQSLDGKRFEVRIRFGCVGPSGPASAAGPFNVRFDEGKRTLRIRATPDLSQTDPRVAALGGEAVEAVEGFWMYRPWLLEAGCPAPLPAPPAPSEAVSEGEESATAVATAVEAEEQPRTATPPTAGQRVGIAHFFTKTDSRAGRRDSRAYEATKVLPEGRQPSRAGYDLVLSGRLATVSGGKVINCRIQGPNIPPECIVSAEFDRVRIETPGTKEVVAEWSN